ncbi:hypothetical protein [Chitinophaga pinensis]|uniref:Uncharacterized protein n=1 Tax=Chitinophaga pinensis TaxID=79329 RepID=A0A5C6LKD0_9BACT|nr:hypothetical protein [Chitinophaga pinensis]TWV89732.1 hypothetical protein FEF09_29760 [Chitinophaga pinensis]
MQQERQALLNGVSVSSFEQALKQGIEQAALTQQTAAEAFNAGKEDLRAFTASKDIPAQTSVTYVVISKENRGLSPNG